MIDLLEHFAAHGNHAIPVLGSEDELEVTDDLIDDLKIFNK